MWLYYPHKRPYTSHRRQHVAAPEEANNIGKRLLRGGEMGDIRLKKCNESDLLVWESVKNTCVVLVFALILMTQFSLNYTLSDISAVAKQ